jgi:6-phosphogluconolactonase (cycloisomerase 2 family)
MKQRFDRREFMKRVGWSSLAGAYWTNSSIFSLGAVMGTFSSRSRFAFVGSANDSGGEAAHGIHVFAIEKRGWKIVQVVASAHPAALVVHPHCPVLYVANAVEEHEGLPCGTVEAYAIDQSSGRLVMLKRQRLSLSGTVPRSLAVSPDGRSLAVALFGGGAYNVLPLDKEGVPGPPMGIRKEVGSGSDVRQSSSHPASLIFDPLEGYLLAADFGANRISTFALDEHRLERVSQLEGAHGAGQLLLHPSRRWLYAANNLEGAIHCHSYDAGSGRVGMPIQKIECAGASTDTVGISLAIPSSGSRLFAARKSGIETWKINPSSGELSDRQSLCCDLSSPRGLFLEESQKSLYVLDYGNSMVGRIAMEDEGYRSRGPVPVAEVEAPISLALTLA